MSYALGAEYQNFHQQLVTALLATIKTAAPFATVEGDIIDADDVEFMRRLEKLSENLNAVEDGIAIGQWAITSIISRYPHITPEVPRDLFWFFGGDCMHFLGEEEIEKFQRLDEAFYAQDEADKDRAQYATLRAEIFGVRKLFGEA